MITKKTWEILSQKQAELGKLIIEKSKTEKNPTGLQWVSFFNAERLKLCLLVEIGELANEIKSFKAWRRKKEIDWVKAKEELIDCLCFFLDLSNLFQVEQVEILSTPEKSEPQFNKLLLELFYKTNNLFILKNEELYNLGKTKISDQNTYYEWLKVFCALCKKLSVNEKELLDIYLTKNKINQQRAREKE